MRAGHRRSGRRPDRPACNADRRHARLPALPEPAAAARRRRRGRHLGQRRGRRHLLGCSGPQPHYPDLRRASLILLFGSAPCARQQPERPGRSVFERAGGCCPTVPAAPATPAGRRSERHRAASRRHPLALLEVEDVVVRFGGVAAVDGASSTSAGAGHRADRPERRRQDDAVQRHHRAAGADHRPGRASTARTSPSRTVPAGAARHRPHVPAARGVRLADRRATTSASRAEIHGGWATATTPTPGASRRAARPGRPRARRRRSRPTRCRPACARLRRAGPGARDRARGCCCSTSRRPGSTRPRPSDRRAAALARRRRPRGAHRRARHASSSWACCDTIHVLDFGRSSPAAPRPRSSRPAPCRTAYLGADDRPS